MGGGEVFDGLDFTNNREREEIPNDQQEERGET